MRLVYALLMVVVVGAVVWLNHSSAVEVSPTGPVPEPALVPLPEPPPLPLSVRTVTKAGAAVHGQAVVRMGPDFRSLYADLAVTPGGDPEPGAIDFRGTAEFTVPAGSHAWMRLVGADGSVAFLHARPSGARTATVLLGNEPSKVHAMVFGPDWRTPAAGARVQATLTPDAGGQRDLGALTAGADGMLVIEGLEPGNVVLRPQGFRPGDGPPFVASVAVGNHGLRRDAVATLVTSGPRRQVRIDALAQERTEPAPSAWLVLRRVDRPDGLLVWSGEPVHEGSQQIALALAVGEWQPLVVPTGELAIAGGDGLLSVREQGPPVFSLHFAPCAARAEVTLGGIDPRHLPLRVMAQTADGMRDDDPERYFGPAQWPAMHASVPALPGAVVLVAQGRGANYVATGPSTLQGAVTVAMQVACWLLVERAEWDPSGKPEVLAVECGGMSWAVPMRPRLVAAPAGSRIVLAADLALPLGTATVQGKEVKLSAPAQVLRLP